MKKLMALTMVAGFVAAWTLYLQEPTPQRRGLALVMGVNAVRAILTL